jgi:hypothetical protein
MESSSSGDTTADGTRLPGSHDELAAGRRRLEDSSRVEALEERLLETR